MKLEGKEPITSEDAQSIIEEVTENSETKEFNASSLTPTEDIHIVSEG